MFNVRGSSTLGRAATEAGRFKILLPRISIPHPVIFILILLSLAMVGSALATVRYVNVNNASPTPPYTNWATAATDIQSAVDAAGAGDEIVVTNGVYAGGSQLGPYGDTDCVVVDRPLTLESVNGPDATVIDGGGTNECVYLTNNAVLVGFTLTNGVAEDGGGVYCESTNAVLTNCVLTGNLSCEWGHGGGAYGGTLNNCTLTGNSAKWGGGGACGCTLNRCTLTGNYATGFVFGWPRLQGSPGFGGGAFFCTLNNCTLTGNSASGDGGGAYGGTLNNCTLTGNSASSGGGAYSCTLNNCIVCFNSDPNNDGGNYDPSSTLNYCCTTPMPTTGVGNISADPQLASASYLSPFSPCIGAGSAAYVSGTDIDGEPWANPPSIGCEEYHAGAVTGPLTLSLTATYTNVATSFPVGLTAFIAGRTDLSVWDFGDGDVQVNEPYTSHAWTAPGDYLVALWAFNDSYPGGVSATVKVHVVEELHYVAAASGNPVPPYTSWATAATNIQDAVDVASVPGATVLVTNGTYAGGGQADPNGSYDLVVVDEPLTIRSVNGPAVTVIDGGGAATCVYLANNTLLVGFTLTNGVATNFFGGGVYCEFGAVLSNCVLSGNSVYYDPNGVGYGAGGGAYGGILNNCTLTGNSVPGVWNGAGGGAYGSTLNDCTLTGNSAPWYGGGADECTLNNCTLTGNSAFWGGGAYSCTLNNCTLTGNTPSFGGGGGANNCALNNCIVYFNDGGNYDSSSTLNYCCTTPMPTSGVGNISVDPQHVVWGGKRRGQWGQWHGVCRQYQWRRFHGPA
jgi:hypothetical protein